MEGKLNNSIGYNHAISINERKMINITGVLKLESFDEEEFLMETNMGHLVIKGKDLELIKLDTKDGVVAIKGLIISMSYLEDLKKQNKKGRLFEKLFQWV